MEEEEDETLYIGDEIYENHSKRAFEGEEDNDFPSRTASLNADELDISKLDLPSQLVDSLRERGITQLFPIQRAVLVPALQGRDIIARAKTGTGKTLAFGIPIINGLDNGEDSDSYSNRRLPRALVLAPTGELAKQVEKEIKESAPYLKTVCIYGGVSYTSQQGALSRGVDVVVGTPGRLIDLINGNTLNLSEVEYLVLDEADQMLAVGFEEAVEVILEKLPAKRQSMLFSATMPSWVKKLARKYLDNPLKIDLVSMDKENGSSQKAEDLKLKEKRKREREKNMPRKKLRKLEAAREMLEKPQQKSIKSRKNSFSRTEEMWELFQTDMKDKKSKQRGSGVGKKPQKSFKSKSRLQGLWNNRLAT